MAFCKISAITVSHHCLLFICIYKCQLSLDPISPSHVISFIPDGPVSAMDSILGYEEPSGIDCTLIVMGRFAIENAFRFEDFTNDELLEILNLKLKSQDLQATDEAKSVAIDVLSRGRNRPNFGNAGEIENQLGLAKDRHQRRQSAKDTSKRSPHIVFEPIDFDPDYNREAQASANMDTLFEGVVGCEDVILKLKGYQQVARGMKAQGRDPRGMIPTNFLFKGPPGTLRLQKVFFPIS